MAPPDTVRVLLYPQKLIVGGSQLVAVDMAARLRDRGHEVLVYGCDGPLRPAIEARGFEVTLAPDDIENGRWPSPVSVRRLRRLVARERIDVIHTYEYGPFLEALIGPYLLDGTPLLGTILTMWVPRFMPRGVPLTVGTRLLRDSLVRDGYRSVTLIEPPVDLDVDRPNLELDDLRARHGVPPEACLAVIVSRLAPGKTESIELAMAAVERLAPEADVRLLVVGTGEDEAELADRARAVNERVGRAAIILGGHLDDPRPAYVAADISIAMGSSALRGMAFGKATIVVGTHGYSEVLTPETSGEFAVQGFWGLGDGLDDGRLLTAQLRSLLDPARRAELGAFGLQLVRDRYDIEHGTDLLERTLETVVARPATTKERWSHAASTMSRLAFGRLVYVPQKLRRRVAR